MSESPPPEKFADMVGEKVFGVVPRLDIQHPLSSDATGVIFELDDRTYLIYEDPDDGYRSHAGPILSFKGAAYELGYDGPGWTYLKEKVICTHRTKGEYGNEDDVLEVRSTETGGLIFAIGTESIDDYYPGFVCNWHPENLSANSTGRIR